MLNHRLYREEGILVIEPDAPLKADDFEKLATEVDPYIGEYGGLIGLMLHAKSFPGWAGIPAFFAHMRFIEGHLKKIRRLAVVSDSEFLTEVPKIASHLVHIEVRSFPYSAYEEAFR